MNIFFQQVLNGLTLGSVYALVALGLTLVYGILHIPNFAHGALYMVGAYIAFYLVGSLGANYWVAMAGAALVVAPKLGDGGLPPLPLFICVLGMLSITFGTIWQKRTGGAAVPLARRTRERPAPTVQKRADRSRSSKPRNGDGK